MSHFIEYYACGEHVYTQCRCANPNKVKRITDRKCPHDHITDEEIASSFETYLETIWIAEAPPGVWASGPTVIFNFPDMAEQTIHSYEEMGWKVRGPYHLEKND